jgi:hypothetical protein
MKNIFTLIPLIFLFACSSKPTAIEVISNSSSPQISYAITKLTALDPAQFKYLGNITIQTVIDTQTLEAEAFSIELNNEEITVKGGDATGVMYGLLDIKEQLTNGQTLIKEKTISPHLSFRAIKYNLPWSSYRNSEALNLHKETCRDIQYWEAFLDMMAENRFNKLTLWNQHPFSYLVKLGKYPEACSLTDAELADWQQFWHQLFQMAADRGIETYLINWNIFVSPEFAKAYGGAEYSIENAYFIEQGDTSEIVKDYMRESVKATINTYPNLAGLGITLGEGMGGMTPEEREKWLLESIVEGMRMADRKVKFIHRVPLSANKGSGGSASAEVEKMTRQTLDTLTATQLPINIELKFNWSHAHSTPHLAKVHGGPLTDAYWNPMPENYRLAWMMRNEDFFMLRWGQADFIRRHIAGNAKSYVNGYFVGSECYIPARDYITAKQGTSYQYAFERQWMFYKNWGRLLFNPNEPDALFEEAFTQRFPEYGSQLFQAQQTVSKVPLIFASFWNATWDFTLYSEGMLTLHNGKMTVLPIDEMMKKTPMEPRFQSISSFVNEGSVEGKVTPLDLADSIDTFCNEATAAITDIQIGNNVDLLYEISDIQTWGNLGKCFANRLRAAVQLYQYQKSGEPEFKEHGLEYLEESLSNWKEVVRITEKVYDPVPLVHMNNHEEELFHWNVFQGDIEAEIEALSRE